MASKPLKATDKRRSGAGDNVPYTVSETDGSAKPLAALFNDRRIKNFAQGRRIA